MTTVRSSRGRTAGATGGVVVRFPGGLPRSYNRATMRQLAVLRGRPGGPFRLGEWTVVPERNQLSSEAACRRVEPKVMDALVALAGRAGDVVSKDELIDAVWEGRIISEGTLSNTLAELRAALGDDARNPRFVETIPKRGYRLICPVESVPVDHDSPSASDSATRRWRWVRWVGGLAALAAVLVATALLVRPRPLDPHRVLVIPFANRTGDPSLDPLATLARDRIAAQLSSSGLATAIPADGAAAGDRIDELCALGRRRGAAVAVSGALYLNAGRVEVQAQLVDVATAEPLVAVSSTPTIREDADRSLDEAIGRVLGALATHLYAHAHATLSSHVPNLEASREFLAGSELYGRDTPGAIEHLRRAVELDPKFSSASFRLAVLLRTAGRGPEGRAILDGVAARRAELTEFECLWLDGFVADFEGRWADALAAQEMIRRSMPDDWTGMHLIAGRQLALNRPRQAIRTLERMQATGVLPAISRHALYVSSFRRLAQARHIVGDHAGELAAARAGLRLFPTDHELMMSEVKALTVLGDTTGVEAVIAEAAATPMTLTHANLLVEAAASARAHGRPQLSLELARRAVAALDRPVEDAGDPREPQLLAEALLLSDELERAQAILEALARHLPSPPRRLAVVARGYLGAVAARRGDLATATVMDGELAAVDDPYLYGTPVYYRAAIAAWLGRREQAIELLRAARASGWHSFALLHDEERVLFEPLEGMPEYEAMLHPSD